MSEEAKTETADAAAPLRVLLLDDEEEAILKPMSRYFRRLGWEVAATTEPEAAEALLEHRAFDVVVLDLALTRFGREGLEVLTSVRADYPWLALVILSACISPEVEAEARRIGADAVLRKPQALPDLARLMLDLVGAAR